MIATLGNPLGTTACSINIAVFAIHAEVIFPQAPLDEDLPHAFWHVREFWVVSWEIHALCNSLAILLKPSIMKLCLLLTRL
jgi:hypothetical protein